MARSTDSLRVLADRVPFIPISVRSVTHISIEEFREYEAAGEWIGRIDDDELTVLYFRIGTIVLSKVGSVALKHWLEPNPAEPTKKTA